MKDALTLANVGKYFEDGPRREEVLKDVSLTVQEGEFFILLGPSGCGKSTLLRIMTGLEPASSGKAAYGPDIRPEDVSFIFQQFAIFPWLTVHENVELGLIARGIPERKRKELVSRELAELGLEHAAHNHPHELSGGMRQRVGIARAIVTEPKIVFMDEPFSALDSFTADRLRKETLRIWSERKMTVVMVTHLVSEALELGDRIAVMSANPGRIEKILPNSLPRPRDLRAKEFFKMNDEIVKLIAP